MGKKGGGFEREICYDLSEWWTGDSKSSVFWRSSMSGGRATVRTRRGLKTQGHAGDVTATTKDAGKFLKVVTLELKRGYSKDRDAPFFFLDAPGDGKITFLSWVQQAKNSQKIAKTPFWMIIAKRDRKRIMVYVPYNFWLIFGCGLDKEVPTAVIQVPGSTNRIVGVRYDDFKNKVSPDAIKRYLK